MPDQTIAGIIDDLNRGYDGDAWHGPSLRKVLEGVTPRVASSRPFPAGHSIWEIVAHLAAWDDVVVRRITERRAIESPDIGDFPPVTEMTSEAWSAALLELDQRHGRLVEVASGLGAERLGESVAGKGYPMAHMIRGVVQHMAYHAGQIALLRKLTEGQAS